MKRILALLLVAAMAAGGCSLKKEEPLPPVPTVDNAINIQLGGEPDTLDPAFAATADEESYIMHLFEGLTILDDKLEPKPGVAESWERTVSDAGVITYTFKLNPEAKWSDGEAVKAEDFIYAWSRVLDPSTKSPLAYRLYPISGAKAIHQDKAELTTLGVKATEDGSLQLVLEGECPDLLQRLATAPWMPLRESVVSAKPNGWYYDADKFLTNGPYTLDKWERDQQITMVRSDSYHGIDSVKAKRLNFVLMEDEAALMAAFKDGTVQLATTLPLLDIEALDKDTRHTDTILGSYILAFNTGKKPFDNADVRKALSLAIDRTAIAAVLRDGSVPATGLVPNGAVVDGTDFRTKGGKLLPAAPDLEKSKKLLKDAGYENGKGMPTIVFLINDEDTHRRVAESVAKMWEPLGVLVEVQSAGWDEYLAKREDGKFDVTRGAIFSDNLYPAAFLDSWTGDNQLNYTGYKSADYDALIDMSYGRKPKVSEEEAKAEEKKTEEKKAEEKKTEEKKTEEKKTDSSEATAKDEAAEPTKTAMDYLTEAEKLLVDTDTVIVPLTWYTNRYAVAPGMDGLRSYPTGTMYFGTASYKKPAEK